MPPGDIQTHNSRDNHYLTLCSLVIYRINHWMAMAMKKAPLVRQTGWTWTVDHKHWRRQRGEPNRAMGRHQGALPFLSHKLLSPKFTLFPLPQFVVMGRRIRR